MLCGAAIDVKSTLPVDRELCAAVLLPAALAMLRAELLFLAVAHRAQAIRAYARRHQRLLRGIGAVFAESQVVLDRSALVAVSADHHLESRVLIQEVRIS